MEIFEMEKEFDELMKKGQQLIEKMKQNQIEKVKRWKPEDGDVYYSVMSIGDVMKYGWNSDYVDCGHYKLGNCFKIEEEAQKELDRRIAEQELLDLADWDETNKLWSCIYYDTNMCEFRITNFSALVLNPYRFASIESAQKAIDKLGEDKLKLIFRID